MLQHDALFSELAARLEAAPLPRRIRAAAAARLGRHSLSALGWSGALALLNGDVSPGHVLIDGTPRRLSGVIDWGDAVLGDPARDFIFLYEDWGDDFLGLALEGYGAAGDPGFLARVQLHYLSDQLSWTLEAAEEGRSDDVEVGVAGLGRALRDLGSIEA